MKSAQQQLSQLTRAVRRYDALKHEMGALLIRYPLLAQLLGESTDAPAPKRHLSAATRAKMSRAHRRRIARLKKERK